MSRTTAFTYRGKAKDVKAYRQGAWRSLACFEEARRSSGARIRVNAPADRRRDRRLIFGRINSTPIRGNARNAGRDRRRAARPRPGNSTGGSRSKPRKPRTSRESRRRGIGRAMRGDLFAVGNTAKHPLRPATPFASGRSNWTAATFGRSQSWRCGRSHGSRTWSAWIPSLTSASPMITAPAPSRSTRNNYLAHYARERFFLRTSVRTKQSRRPRGRLALNPEASCRPISRFGEPPFPPVIRRRRTNIWRQRFAWARAIPTDTYS